MNKTNVIDNEEISSVTIYRSMSQSLELLPPETELRLRHAIDHYELEGIEPDFKEDPIAQSLWIAFRPNIDGIMKQKRNSAKKKKNKEEKAIPEPKQVSNVNQTESQASPSGPIQTQNNSFHTSDMDPGATQPRPTDATASTSIQPNATQTGPKPDPNRTQPRPKPDPTATQTGPYDRWKMVDDRCEMIDNPNGLDIPPYTPNGVLSPQGGPRACACAREDQAQGDTVAVMQSVPEPMPVDTAMPGDQQLAMPMPEPVPVVPDVSGGALYTQEPDQAEQTSEPEQPDCAHDTRGSEHAYPGKQRKTSSKRFVPPTQEEALAHGDDYIARKLASGDESFRGITFNAEAFMCHYESNGWKVGRNKMRSWRKAVEGWILRDVKKAFDKSRGKRASPTQTPFGKNSSDWSAELAAIGYDDEFDTAEGGA